VAIEKIVVNGIIPAGNAAQAYVVVATEAGNTPVLKGEPRTVVKAPVVPLMV